MSSVYTEIAKRRADQSKEPVSHGFPSLPAVKPSIQVAQDKGVKPATVLTCKAAKLPLASPDSEKVEKYTTHLEPSMVKKIKLAAIEKDIKSVIVRI
jgi:hypothetical protein